MRQPTRRITGRRGARLSPPAAALCALLLSAALLSGCGSGGGDGELAVGAAGPADGRAPTGAVPPGGGVALVPLAGGSDSGASGRSDRERPGDSDAPQRPSPSESSGAHGSAHGDDGGHGDDDGADSGAADGTDGGDETQPSPGPSGRPSGSTPTPGETPRPGPSGSPRPTEPPSPADLSWEKPERAAADQRWCEKVSLTFHNSGGTAVRSGTITFGTHVIGPLGIDWSTITSTVGLPAPIEAGAEREKGWTVCVDAWRVPLGMHIETRDVSVDWR